MANQHLLHLQVRQADHDDLSGIAELMERAPYSHVHADWRTPRHWLDKGRFVLVETTPQHAMGGGVLFGCLALGADPPPAAWVRVAAVRGKHLGAALLKAMIDEAVRRVKSEDVREVGWLPRNRWPAEWMEALQFNYIDEVVTYLKHDVEIPDGIRHNEAVHIRAATAEDMPRLVAIEHDAFDPLWRHSVESLSLGRRYSLSFHVAELQGRIAGFQYSSDSDLDYGAHLVRLTVAPQAQRSGVGSALLRAALESYRRRGLEEASLNTQLSNEPSRRLYEKFGFRPGGHHWPVWSWRLHDDENESFGGR